MGDEDDLDAILQGVDESEAVVKGNLTQASIGELASLQENVAQILVEDANLEKLTNLFTRAEPTVYAKMNYLLAVTDSIGRMDEAVLDVDDKVRGVRGFEFPDFSLKLIRPDYQLRTSYKQATRHILRDITKIFERGGDAVRKSFLRK